MENYYFLYVGAGTEAKKLKICTVMNASDVKALEAFLNIEDTETDEMTEN